MWMHKRLKAIIDAMRGIAICVTRESHGRLHTFIAIAVIATGVFLGASVDDWCWFVACIGMVIACEAVNTSIERLADRVSEEYHYLIRDAKDLAAGAVLIVSIASAVIGLLRLYPLIMRMFPE